MMTLENALVVMANTLDLLPKAQWPQVLGSICAFYLGPYNRAVQENWIDDLIAAWGRPKRGPRPEPEAA